MTGIDRLLEGYGNPSELDREWWERYDLLQQLTGTLYSQIVKAEMDRIRFELYKKWGRGIASRRSLS